jgi:mono/diheme cytochrome c family protein
VPRERQQRPGRAATAVRWGVVAVALIGLAAACGALGGEDEAAEVARGEELYDRYCISCHGGETGGDIADVPPPHNAQGHTWHHPDCQLVDVVLDGLPPREGYPQMPAFRNQLDEEDVMAILAHIRTWWDPDQQEFQAEVTERVC